jgi:hypothetical protein
MAIGTDAAIDFFGTPDEIISIAGAAVSDGAFSDSGDLTQWVNDDDAILAEVAMDATMAVAPDAGSVIGLFARMMNISDSTQDANVPATTFLEKAMANFPMDSAGTAQLATRTIVLPNHHTSQEYDFYVLNEGGQDLSTGSTWDIVPKARGPHA